MDMERDEQDPGQEFRREVFERNDEVGSAVTRLLIAEKMGNPSEIETKEALQLITSGVLNPMLEECTSRDALKMFKEVFSKTYGYPLSAPLLSSSVIYDIAMSLSSETTQGFKNTSLLSSVPIELICVYDVSVGIMEAVSAIKDAENSISGTSDNELVRHFSERLAGTFSLSDQADFFLSKKAEALKYSKLLKEDPTGRNLIRHVVQEIENPKKELYPNLREFVVHGARFAQSAYEIVYPLAEKIIKPT